jgi:MoaA/NifB/PqqE/SkfB family radical SAM enzyme
MRLFNTLCLEISARCNRRCVFCPVAYHVRPDEVMPYELQRKAYKELAELNYKGRIEFYIYNEPMRLKDHLYNSIEYARKMVPRATLMIATNGDYLKNAEDLWDLYELGLNQVLINCYTAKQYPRAQQWMDDIGVDQEKSVYYPTGPRSKVGQVLDKSDVDSFGSGVFSLVNRAGNISEFMPAVEEPLERMCVKPFRIFNINWKGVALVCCQDYHGKVPLGSLQDRTLVELWRSPILNEYRRRLLLRDRTLPLCNRCDCHAGAYPANVDTNLGQCATKEAIERLAEGQKETPPRREGSKGKRR